MLRTNRQIVAFFLALLLAAASGCGRRPAAYDSLRSDVLTDLAQALEGGDSEATLRSLDRLETLTREGEFVARLREREEARQILLEFREAVMSADYARAARALASGAALASRYEELARAARLADALAALDLHLAGRPYRSADSLATALDQLERKATPLGQSPTYARWLQVQLRDLKSMREKERRAQLARLVAECARAAAADAVDVEIFFAKLRDFAPGSLPARLYAELRDGTTDQLQASLEDPAEWRGDPLCHMAMEACLLACHERLDLKWLDAFQRAAGDAPPESEAGYLLKVVTAGRGGRAGEAMLWTRRYLDAGYAPSERTVKELTPLAFMKPAQFNAHAWRVPLPSVGALLERFAQWHANRPGEGGAN
jgi:hypothetical protein